MRARARRVPLPLALLLGVAFVLAAAWSLAMPPLQGFDEPDHVAYVAHLAEHGSPPSPTTGTRPYSQAEATLLGPLGYGRLTANPEARPPWQPGQAERYEAYLRSLPADDLGSGEGPNPLAKNPPLYYAYEAIPFLVTGWLGADLPARLTWMRLWSSLLFVGTVACAWGVASELFRRLLPRVVVTGFVALQPVAGYLGGVVNSDTGLMFGFTALAWLSLRLVRLGPSPARAIAPALLAAACVLTHGRGLAAIPVLLVAVAVALVRHRPGLRAGAIAAACSVGTLLVGLLAYRAFGAASGGGSSLYGGEVNLGQAGAFSVTGLLSQTWQFYLGPLRTLPTRLGPDYGFAQVWVETYFGSFGSYEIALPSRAYDLAQVLLVGTFLAALALLVSRGAELVRERWAQLLVLAALAASVLGLLHAASYRALVSGSSDPLMTGRYLLPVTVVVGVCLAALVARLRRTGPWLAGASLAGMVLLSLAGLALTMQRFYA